jgi:transcriptional regulator with XRE-family HTH domain
MSRLRRLRELRGFDPHQLARDLEITSPWYFDLEVDSSDWADQISIRGLRSLAHALEVAPSSLFELDGEPVATAEIFVERLADYLKANGLSAAEFSVRIGWDVERIVTNPKEVGNLNAAGFKAISEALGLDWLATLDEMKI